LCIACCRYCKALSSCPSNQRCNRFNDIQQVGMFHLSTLEQSLILTSTSFLHYSGFLCMLHKWVIVESYDMLTLSPCRMFFTGTLWMSSHFPLRYLHTQSYRTVHTLIPKNIQWMMPSTLYSEFFFHWQSSFPSVVT
jgi:hypothetical protein